MNQPLPIPQQLFDTPATSAQNLENVLKSLPPFILEQHRFIFSMMPTGFFKGYVVRSGVASIGCPHILIRFPLHKTSVEDGLYYQSDAGIRKAPALNFWHGVPDYDSVKPDFQALIEAQKCAPIVEGAKDAMIGWAEHAKTRNAGIVVFSDRLKTNYNMNLQDFAYPFNVATPRPDLAGEYSATAFQMAITNSLLIENCFILKEFDERRQMPLIVGRDWSCCAVIPDRNVVSRTHFV
jgi:hypothetical protein